MKNKLKYRPFNVGKASHICLCLIAACFFSLSASADVLLDIDGSRKKNIYPDIFSQEFEASQIDTEKFELSAYTGAYKYENFDSRPILGFKAAYHASKRFFFEVDYSASLIKSQYDSAPTAVNIDENITMYDLALGFNLMRGQIFRGDNKTISTSTFIKYGSGKVKVVDENFSFTTLGFGIRLLLPNDVSSLQFGVNQDSVKGDATISAATNSKIFAGFGVYF